MDPKIRKYLPALICSILALILGIIVSDTKLALLVIGIILLFAVIPDLIKEKRQRKHHPRKTNTPDV
ncbi:hypothetical protein [Corynebacterium macginleyi]|uniref:Uncharacterized protein n=1 Tax=Corynebacterium macginleyi TaxID=38290 RepID=A0ABS1Y3T6_9CORY|nr:hypothetical protein [Corynebacterium macginleyi]MBK4148190.1 hypothetical protein [Corynebacterium macginleyi]MBK4160161.1 hypothetical protein [Corynebacterium macginleyi]MBK4165326.1 hypothetical protein [Corynebacterium macginleyi]MBK4178159.1 hypothetical protein [Corynebacterium macginleyi]MBM0243050.1 hypothetical protein [Corynebacterium macginleyi]